MRKADVRVGATYVAKVSGALVPVTILAETTRYDAYSGRTSTGWRARNERTGREVTIKSAQRLRFEVKRLSVSEGRGWTRV